MSPALLSKRLRELEQAGIVHRVASKPGIIEYHLTRSGKALKTIVDGIGIWGQQWMQASMSLENLDASLLMWGMRQYLNPTLLPQRRCTIQFLYPEQKKGHRHWWLVVDRVSGVDLCAVDPGFEVDVYITASLRIMTEIWMGLMPLRAAFRSAKVKVVGDHGLVGDIQSWLPLSPFAPHKKLVAG